MQRIDDQLKLKYYIDKYNIKGIFNNNMEKYMELHLYKKDEHIGWNKEKLNYFYFLVEGKVKIYTLLSNGKSLLLQFYRPLTVIGDLEFNKTEFASSNIQAIEDSLFIGIPMEKLREIASNDTKFLMYIINTLSTKLIISSSSSSINLLYPVENRLASYLLATTVNDNMDNMDRIYPQKLTEIADLLGTSYRHLVRTINKLCQQKIIKKEKGTIIILDKGALEELAGDIYK